MNKFRCRERERIFLSLKFQEFQIWLYTWYCNIVISNRSGYQELRREDIFRVSGGASKSWTLHFHKSAFRIYRCRQPNSTLLSLTSWLRQLENECWASRKKFHKTLLDPTFTQGASVSWNCAQFVSFEFEFKAPRIYLSYSTSRVEEEQGRESRPMR
jgi:hypothetical protein